MIDTVSAVIALLKTSPALVAAVTHPSVDPTDFGRPIPWIFGSPPGLPSRAPTPAPGSIVLRKAGGTIRAEVPIAYPRFYVLCYGQDGREADTIFNLVVDVCYDTLGTGKVICNRLINNQWFFYWAQIQSMDAPNVEPDSARPFAPGTLQAMVDTRDRSAL